MDDRTMLELAAKASGILFRTDPMGQYRDCSVSHDPAQNIFAFPLWNPLTDDGDALRLAVTLQMTVISHRDRICVSPLGFDWTDEYETVDQLAATRRAIVRAAAEIGRKMP